MISLSVIVRFEFSQDSPERCLSEENELREAFSFYRLHPSFRVSVGIPCGMHPIVTLKQKRLRSLILSIRFVGSSSDS